MQISTITKQLKEGSPEAKAYLYEKYRSNFIATAYGYTNNWADAEDVVGDAFIRIFKYIHQLKDDEFLLHWCTTVVKSVAINFIRKRKRECRYEETAAVNRKYSLQRVEDKMHLDTVKKKIQKLPPGYATVITMAGLEELTGVEIASKLGIKEVTSRTQLWKARTLLRKMLNETVD